MTARAVTVAGAAAVVVVAVGVFVGARPSAPTDRPPALACHSGEEMVEVTVEQRAFAAGLTSPIEAVREFFREPLHSSDRVRSLAEHDVVAITRDDRIVALVTVGEFGRGWLVTGYRACARLDPFPEP